VNRRKLAPADVVILAAGAVMLIGSFLAFYKLPAGFAGTVTFNAWDRGFFMIAALPALLGAVMALQIFLGAFGNITMPNRVLGLTWEQFHLVLSLQAALLMLMFLARSRYPTVSYGNGFWLMLTGSGGLLLGALMRVASSRRRPRAI
jgi:hypothetical protein